MDEAKQKRVALNPDTHIRWRYAKDQDGKKTMETNAHFVRWSDGSLQLIVGKESYDVAEQRDSSMNANYLFVRQNKFIQCHGKFDSKLIFRPSSLGSESHEKLSATIAAKHKREKKIKMVTTKEDPEKLRLRMEELEAQRIKGASRLESTQKRKRRSLMGGSGLSSEFIEEGYSAEELEEEYDNQETGNLSDDGMEESPKGKKSQRIANNEESEKKSLQAKSSQSQKSKKDNIEVVPVKKKIQTEKGQRRRRLLITALLQDSSGICECFFNTQACVLRIDCPMVHRLTT